MNKEKIANSFEKIDSLRKSSKYIEAKLIALELLENNLLHNNLESLGKVYNILGSVNWRLSDFLNAIEYYKSAVQIYEKMDDANGIGGNLVNLGNVYDNLSDYQKSLECYHKAIVFLEKIQNKHFLSNAFKGIGNVYGSLSDYPKSLDYFQKSLHINEEIGNIEGNAGILGNIGVIYMSLSENQLALEYLQQALHINEEFGNKFNIAGILGNIGNAYRSLFDYNKALEYMQKALQINEEIGNKDGIARNLQNIGIVYSNLSNFSKSLEYCQKSLHIFEEIESKRSISINLLNIGGIYANKTSNLFDIIKAEEYLQRAFLCSKEIGAKDIIKDVYNELYNLKLQEKKFEDALEFYIKYTEVKDEIISEQAKKEADKFDFERKNAEREKLLAIERIEASTIKNILHNILPVNIALRIIRNETFIADYFQSVSVLFMDLVGFTSLASKAPAKQLVYLLDSIFTKADEVVEQFGLEKIKTIGDGYLAVANVTTPLENHQQSTANAALQLLEIMKDFTVTIPSDLGDTSWIKTMNDIEIRIGIHTGEVVAGIIGKNKYTYDLWGDAVNVASRMESNSEAGRIHISEAFAKSIELNSAFSIIPRGEINIKGKGTMNTFWLEKAK